MRKIIGYFFISALVSILTLIYYTFYWQLYIPLLPTQPSVKYILVIGHFLFFMLLWCLVSVIFSEPGKVPPYWGFYQTDNESRQKRYCMLCHVFKPDRCHHCSVCNRCVLNMDHHCPWINNCVGFFNRKNFILLLVYSLSNLYFIFLFMTPVIWDTVRFILKSKAAQSFFPHFQYIGVYLLVLFLMLILTNFTKFHINLVLNNSTTIESFDKSSNSVSYNAGTSKNWRQVFGKNPYLWFTPIYGATGKPDGDGVIWPQTFVLSEKREGFEIEVEQDNKKVLKLDVSKEEKSKMSDSDTSFLSHNKKTMQVDLRDN